MTRIFQTSCVRWSIYDICICQFIATFNNLAFSRGNETERRVKTRRFRVDKRRLDARDTFIESMKLLVLITLE